MFKIAYRCCGKCDDSGVCTFTHIHEAEFKTLEDALKAGHELTRDFVANTFRVFKLSKPETETGHM